MPFEILIALAGFAFVSSITPGPNNLMLMASGVNFGFRRTIPHMLGVGLGFTFMIVLIGIGLMELFDAVPVTYTILKIVCAVYLLWLAWKIANAAEPKAGTASTPITFLQAAVFQWVNPKAWFMATAAITAYAPERNLFAVLLVAIIFGAINIPCVSLWTILGQNIRRVLGNPKRLRVFNWSMAAFLIVSVWPLLFT
ncbi:MAG: LysE family translocator [Pseudomonadota bacterium]